MPWRNKLLFKTEQIKYPPPQKSLVGMLVLHVNCSRTLDSASCTTFDLQLATWYRGYVCGSVRGRVQVY